MADFAVGRLSVEVRGREKDNPNRLIISAVCETPGSRISVEGPFLDRSDLLIWMRALELMDATLSGTAALRSGEGRIAASLSLKSRGAISAVVEVSPDPPKESHRFEFPLDQTFLRPLIAELQNLLKRYPFTRRPRP